MSQGLALLCPAPPTTTAPIFGRAADILEEFDWRQGNAGSREEGSMCAVGAIYEALDDLGIGRDDDRAVQAYCAHGRPSNECAIFPLAVWNDRPERTKAEVVAELRRLAERADGDAA